MKNDRFSLLKHFKDTYLTFIIIPIIALQLLAAIFLTNWYSQGIISLPLVVMGTIITVGIGILIICCFVFFSLNGIVKKGKEEQVLKCSECSADFKKYLFSRHQLLTFDEIISKERKLKDHPQSDKCIVYNYTMLKDTINNGIEKVIQENKEAGVQYYIFYKDEVFDYLDNRNRNIYGAENMVLSEINKPIYEIASFDYLIYKTPEALDCYVAICFISNNGYCGSCQHKPCDYINDHVFYRKLPAVETAFLYEMMSKQLEQSRRDKGN